MNHDNGKLEDLTLDQLDQVYGSSWEEPQPLPSELLPVMSLDSDWLPEPFQAYAKDTVKRMQCPFDYVAINLMAAMGGVLGKKCCVYPKQKDDWKVVPNLWAAAIGQPSAMKTPAMNAAMIGVYALIEEASEAYPKALEDYEYEKVLFDEQKKLTKKLIGEALNDGKNPREIPHPVKPDMPAERRHVVNACSVERLIGLLNENPDGLILNRDELTGWLNSMDNSNTQDARAFYLEAWNGSGGLFSYDTMAHGHVKCVGGVCISIIGNIQPEPLGNLIKKASGGGDGLIQRFQLMTYPDTPKDWEYTDIQPDPLAVETIKTVFKRAHELKGAFHFDDEAQEVFIQWVTELKNRDKEEHGAAIEMHLSKYDGLMPSLALIIHLAEHAQHYDMACMSGISASSARKAVKWCAYLKSHALRVYSMVNVNETEAARRLLTRAVNGRLNNPFKACEVQRKKWANLASKEQVKNAIETLEDYGWLRVDKLNTGGRPSEIITLHPQAKKYIKSQKGGATKGKKRDERPLVGLVAWGGGLDKEKKASSKRITGQL